MRELPVYKPFTYDPKTNSILQDDEFWLEKTWINSQTY